MEFLHNFLGPNLNAAGFAILGLILVESLLSVDNAAVLATMVMDLPTKQRGRALRIGLFVGYIFRGVCLLLASWLMKIKWLSILGGMYLVFLAVQHFYQKVRPAKEEEGEKEEKKTFWSESVRKKLGVFWSTVLMVEIMDLAFSMDNVFAAVAYVHNFQEPYRLRLVIVGVFIGILAMRFVAAGFVKLMEKFPFLEFSAFLVVGILGVKLILSNLCFYFPDFSGCAYIEGEHVDLLFSLGTLLLFAVPVLTSWLFNVPKKQVQNHTHHKQ